MLSFSWQKIPLIERIRRLRSFLPIVIVLVVLGYQLLIARILMDMFGHFVHFTVEIAFYSLVGPAVTWMSLKWIEQGLEEKETLERQVQSQSQQLASLASASADAIISLDNQNNILSWNRGAKNLFGYLDTEIIGESLEKILPESFVLQEYLKRDGIVQDFETEVKSKNGQSVTINLTQTQVDDEVNEAPISLMIMRDITTQRERRAILEEERARIARDLHDGVAQTLYFLALKADMAHSRIEQQPHETAEDLQEIGRETRKVIREIRRTIFALRPLDWKDNGFIPALHQFVEDFAEQVGWQAKFKVDQTISLPSRLEPTIFRLIQESLNNVAKHAEAKNVSVYLKQITDGYPKVLIQVSDDGIGFDQKEESSYGIGLNQMQQRVLAYDGAFEVVSGIGQGTTVNTEIPLVGNRL